ncbi:MAG TPA: hypothetical protein VMA36_08340 [Candidatus Limnocylindria bacterium]|uniref:Uncharacterized protein n=2 Tax=Paraburkholderia edwinii TaxID=2861782 RepID=A0ABX8UXK4_9BURK|nr:hypothetical protein KZJ38_21930 [Paraburkholderia edwinii]HTJ26159.1 hypothetical protein [Candidatus Limnocylindria bacterium]
MQPHAGDQGQAMVEFLVVTMFAISVLFITLAMLGKFSDIRNKTLLGARYAAWERSVWLDAQTHPTPDSLGSERDWFATYGSGALQLTKSDIEIQREFMQRTIAANGAPLLASDRDADRLPAVGQAMWRDHGGEPLLGAAQDVIASTGAAPIPAAALASYTDAPYGSVRTANGATYTAALDLPTRNLQSGTVSVAIGKQSDALRRLWRGFGGLTFADTNVLLTNTWLPEGPMNGRALFTRAVPAANAELVSSAQVHRLRPYAPEIDTLEFGRVRHEVVPNDRLAP